MVLFFSFMTAMFVTMVLIPPLIKSAKRLKLVDMPNERKVHIHAVPRIGGVAMIVGVLLPVLLWVSPSAELLSFLSAAAVIFVFGVWDDRKTLNYMVKFLGQLVAVAIVVVYGGVRIALLPFFGAEPLADAVSVPLTMLFLLGVINAINLSDGLDGLAGGMTLLSVALIAVLAHMVNDVALVLVALAVMGSVLGFMRFNTYPARVFMGDSGSQFLGFTVGVLAILLTQRVNTALSVTLPLLILGLPILDTLMVMAQRLAAGRSPFASDNNHIHHKLMKIGFDHFEAVSIIYVLQAGLMVAAYLLRYQSDALILGVYAGFCAVLMGLLVYADKHPRRLQEAGAHGYSAWLRNKAAALRGNQRLARTVSWLPLFALPVYFLLSIALSAEVPLDIVVSAGVLLASLGILFLARQPQAVRWIERAGLYVVCALVVYLNSTVAPQIVPVLYSNILFAVLLGVIVLAFIAGRSDGFRATPLDLLVIFVALVAPNLRGLEIYQVHLGQLVMQLIVLFYSVELVIAQHGHRRYWVRILILSSLSALLVKGLVV